MKPHPAQQEILLMTTTSFTQGQCYDEYKNFNYPCLSSLEQLELACWNGLLDDMLPEISELINSDNKLPLWHIRNGKNYLLIGRGEFPLPIKRNYSIDAGALLRGMLFN